MSLAPIALFVYNRPEHTRRTIAALQKNALAGQSVLIIFSDGWKSEVDQEAVLEVRRFLKEITGFQSIEIIVREKNLGLAASIIDGVTAIVNRFGNIIVLEDDLVTSPYFLTYMNDALHCYKSNEQVISIHGFMYPLAEPLPDQFFLRGADCWGWATWKRGWDLFEPNGKILLDRLQEQHMTYQFDLDRGYPFTQMLKLQIGALNSSWAIRWYASAFLADKLTLYPGISLVQNIGFDNTGRHSGKIDWFPISLTDSALPVRKIDVVESLESRKKLVRYFKSPKLRMLTIVMWVRGAFRLIQKNIYDLFV